MVKDYIPKLTVIVPVYNTDSYLVRCLDSILNQSLKEIEVIIVNDQSTDNSENIILQYLKKHGNTKYFTTNKRCSAGGARNIALNHAKGEYVGFVDSDDWIDSNMYLKLIDLMKKSGAEIGVCGVMKEYNHPFDSSYRYNYDFENIVDGPFALELLTRRRNQDIYISPIVCNKVYNLDFLRRYNLTFLEKSFNEDDVFNYFCFMRTNKVAIAPTIYYHYYQRDSSITHSFSKKHIDDLFGAFTVIKKHLEEQKLFQMQKNNYYAYFEKCFGFVLDLLIVKEPSTLAQDKYLRYIFSHKNFQIIGAEFINYCGALRLRNFFHPPVIK